jgi:outer membrane protein assembly factor BamB
MAAEPEAEKIDAVEMVDLSVYDNKITLEPIWSKKLGVGYGMRYLRLVPTHDEETVYGVDWRGELFAFDKSTGEERWQIELPSHLTGGLSFGQQMVVIGGGDGSVYAIDRADGEVRWRSKVSSEVLSRSVIAGGIVVVHTNDGKVTGLNGDNGKTLWTYQYKVPVLTLRGASSPLMIDESRVVVGLANGKLVLLDVRTGVVLWEQTVATPQGRSELQRMVDVDANPLLIGNTIYTVAYQGRIAAMDVSSGRIIWTRDMSSYTGMSGDDRLLYVSDADGNVHGVDRFNGAMLWKQDKLQSLSLTEPLLFKGQLIVGAKDGYLYWLSTEDGAIVSRTAVQEIADRLLGMEWDLWEDYTGSGLPDFFKEDTGINVAPVVVDGEMLLSADNQGRITAFRF